MEKPAFTVSLAWRFAAVAALLAGIAMVVMGGASLWLIHQEHTAAMRVLMKKDASLRAATVGDNLRVIATQMSELSRSKLIVRALLDNADKERVLIPYLNDIQGIRGIPVSILFADFQGVEIASNGSVNGQFNAKELSWLKEKLGAGQPDSSVHRGEKGDELMAVEFIAFAPSKSVEGALLYKIKLDAVNLGSGVRLVRGPEAKQLLQSPTAISAALDLPAIYKHLDFAVLANPETPASPFDWQLVSIFLILTFGMVVAVTMVGQYFGKRLTSDLQRLQSFAHGVAEKGFGATRANSGGSLESASLTRSVNRMLDQLRYKHNKLRESEERFRSLFEYAEVGMNVRDADSKFVEVNPAFAAMMGYSKEELLGVSFNTITHPDDIEPGMALINMLVKGERENFQMEKKFIRRDGSSLWGHVTVSAVRDAAGKLTSFIGVTQDITGRKLAEAALQKQSQRLSEVIWASNVGTWDWNVQTGEQVVNDQWAGIVGYTLGELAPITIDTWTRLLHPDDKRHVDESLEQCFSRASEDYFCDVRMRHKNGEWVWVSDRGRVVEWTTDGKPLRMSGMHREITNRKLAEAALLASLDKLRLASAAADLYDWEWDVPRDALTWGRNPLHLLGQPDERTGKYPDFRDLMHPEDRDRYLAAGRHAMRTGEPYSIEFRIVERDGRIGWIAARGKCVFDSAGAPARMIGVSQNITERKRAEAELVSFKNVLDNTLDLIFMFEPDSLRFVYVNQGAAQTMGYTREELLELKAYDIKPLLSEADLRQRMAPLLSGAEPMLRFDTVHRRKCGTYFPVNVLMQLVKQSDGNAVFVAIVHDITERQQARDDILRINASLEDRVQQRTAQLESSNRELEEFAYSLAHDLRQPFIAIGGFTGMLERTVTDERARHYIARINAGVRRAGELTDALLSLANLSRVPLDLQDVDISVVARSLMASLQDATPERPVTVSIQDGLVVHADPKLIRLVLQELLGNAWKFTSKKSNTEISFGLIVTPTAGEDPVYVVSDNGEGFDMAYADKLFRSFQSLHTVQNLSESGAGLANVQRIVARHDGRVWADSTLGEGARFFFTLGGRSL